MKQKLTFLYVAYFFIFIFLIFFNLDRIPLVWFDEVMGLDPAVNLIFKDGFQSKIWPQTGTEEQFMAYLPVRFLFHSIHLVLLPFKVYWMRLPWLIYFLISAYLLMKSVKDYSFDWFLPLVVCFIFINDRTVFEVVRSMRLDAVSLMFIALGIFAHLRKNSSLQAFCASVMVFVHPNLWALALVLFLDAHLHWNAENKRDRFVLNRLWLIPVSFLGIYAYSINFDFQGLYTQLFEHGSEHSAEGGFFMRFKDHFVSRFWPYYYSQPYIPLLIYFALGRSVYRLLKKNCDSLDIALIATHVYWLLLLAPFYRYNAVLLLISLFSLLPTLYYVKLNNWALAVIALLFLVHPLNVISRHTVAVLQRSERNPETVVTWLKAELPQGKSLIMGHDVAYYAVAKNPNIDYVMFNLGREKINFNEYTNFLVLTDAPLPQDHKGPVKSYLSKKSVKHSGIEARIKDIATYEQMYFYSLKDSTEFIKVQDYLDGENYSVNRD